MRRVLLALLLLAPLASAQGADPTVTITADASEITVSREDQGTIELTVALDSQNPLDQNNPRRINVAISDLPPHWAVTLSESSFTLTSGQTKTITATVILGAGAQEAEQSVSFVATAQERGGTGLPGDTAVSSSPATVRMVREDPLTREVLEGVGPWIWLVLGGLAILAVVLAVYLSNNNRVAVGLTSSVKTAKVRAGRSVAVPIKVENLTPNDDTVIFHVAPVTPGWAASLPVPELPLDGRRSEELHLVITSPANAAAGDSVSIGITAHSAQNPKRMAELITTVTVAA